MKAEYDYADEHGLVCVMDIGKCGSESWQTDRLLRVIKEHPAMKFVVCHLLAVSMRDEDKLVEGLKKLALPNVWFDLAALPHNCGPDAYPYPNAVRYLRHGIKIAGADKLIFGTDILGAEGGQLSAFYTVHHLQRCIFQGRKGTNHVQECKAGIFQVNIKGGSYEV